MKKICFFQRFSVGILLLIVLIDNCPSLPGNLPSSRMKPNFASSQIEIEGNEALDDFCTGTDGLTWETAHIIENQYIDLNGQNYGISIKNTDRFLIIRDCIISNTGGLQLEQCGISLENCTNVKIENCSISFSFLGLELYKCSDVNMTGLYASSCVNAIESYKVNNSFYYGLNTTGNYNFGLLLQSCVNFSISGSNFSYNWNFGTYLLDCENGTIDHCAIDRNSYLGLNIAYINSISIQNSTISQNLEIGLYSLSSTNVSIQNNSISGSESGIEIHESENVTVSNNSITSCVLGLTLINLENSSFHMNEMIGNSIFLKGDLNEIDSINVSATNSVNGDPVCFFKNSSLLTPANFSNPGQIILSNCSDSILDGLYGVDVSAFIQILHSVNITVNNTDIYDAVYGFYTYNCNNLSINSTNLTDCEFAVYLESTNETTITKTNYDGNYGLYLRKSEGASVYNCKFGNIAECGLYIDQESMYNKISLCEFQANINSSYDSGVGNLWDYNLWADFSTKYPYAMNNLTQWDTPYDISGSSGSKDFHPRVEENTKNELPIVIFPEDDINQTLGSVCLVNWTILDRTANNSAYTIFLNDTPIEVGKWRTGINNSVEIHFRQAGEFILRVEISDGMSPQNISRSITINVFIQDAKPKNEIDPSNVVIITIAVIVGLCVTGLVIASYKYIKKYR